YNIKLYPTLLFLDAQHKEIGRIEGYNGIQKFYRDLDLILEVRQKSLKALEKAARQGDLDASDKVGLYHYYRDNFEKAAEFFKTTTAYPLQKRFSELKVQKAKSNSKPELREKWAQEMEK